MNEYETQEENPSMNEILRAELEKLWKEAKMGQAEIGEKLGVKQSSVSRIIEGSQPLAGETLDRAIEWLRPWDHKIRNLAFHLHEEDKLTVTRLIVRLRYPPGQAEKQFKNILIELRPS